MHVGLNEGGGVYRTNNNYGSRLDGSLDCTLSNLLGWHYERQAKEGRKEGEEGELKYFSDLDSC